MNKNLQNDCDDKQILLALSFNLTSVIQKTFVCRIIPNFQKCD